MTIAGLLVVWTCVGALVGATLGRAIACADGGSRDAVVVAAGRSSAATPASWR